MGRGRCLPRSHQMARKPRTWVRFAKATSVIHRVSHTSFSFSLDLDFGRAIPSFKHKHYPHTSRVS